MIEVLKQMVEALEVDAYVYNGEKSWAAIKAGKQAIAELESQEPVAKLKTSNVLLRCHRCGYSDKLTMQIEYTHPPQRTETTTCERCKQLEEQVYDLLGRLQAANLGMAMLRQADQFKEKNT